MFIKDKFTRYYELKAEIGERELKIGALKREFAALQQELFADFEEASNAWTSVTSCQGVTMTNLAFSMSGPVYALPAATGPVTPTVQWHQQDLTVYRMPTYESSGFSRLVSATFSGRAVEAAVPQRPRAQRGEIADAVRDILVQQQRPVSTRDLLTMLTDRGVVVGGRNPINTLAAHLSYYKRYFTSIRRGPTNLGWVLKNQQLDLEVSPSAGEESPYESDPVPMAAQGGAGE